MYGVADGGLLLFSPYSAQSTCCDIECNVPVSFVCTRASYSVRSNAGDFFHSIFDTLLVIAELDVRSCSFFFMNPDSSSRRPALPAGDFSDSDDDDNDDDDDDNDGDGGSNAKEELFLLPQLTQLRRLNLSNTDISTKNAVTLIQ